MPTRAEVYKAVDSERNYQDQLARNNVPEQTQLEHLTVIRRIVRDIEDAWYENPGHPPLDYMRKIAAVAVKAMEQHGAPTRTGYETPKKEEFGSYDFGASLT
jgi:hypothetical protein